jgi:hypothetical protein
MPISHHCGSLINLEPWIVIAVTMHMLPEAVKLNSEAEGRYLSAERNKL